jgi:hypothetical protein
VAYRIAQIVIALLGVFAFSAWLTYALKTGKARRRVLRTDQPVLFWLTIFGAAIAFAYAAVMIGWLLFTSPISN